MDGLNPRPKYNGPLYSWDRLNQVLQSNFNGPGEHTVMIDLRAYSIPKNEIITEAEKQGYKVSEQSPYFLKFE